MDKHEIIEILRAAADGIEKRDSGAKTRLELDKYKRLFYNFLKINASLYCAKSARASMTFINESQQAENVIDFLIRSASNMPNVDGTEETINNIAKEMFKKLTNGDEPPEE